MIPFILLINCIEVFLFSSFIAYFFNLKHKMKYILIIGTINYTITNLSSFFSYYGIFLTISVIIVTVLGLILETKTINFETLFIPIVYNIFIILCTTISIWTVTTILSIDSSDIFKHRTIYYIACILAKILQLIFSIFFYSITKKDNITLKLKEWWIVIVTEVSMIISIGLCLYSLNFKKLNLDIIKILLFLSILSNILFYLVILMSNKNNIEKIKNAKQIQKYTFNKQKYATIEHLKKETDFLNHRMFYILWQIELLAEKKEFDQIKTTVKKYKNLLNKNQYVINSGNDIFDYIFSLNLTKYFDNGTDLKISVAIQKNNFYDNIEFINHLINILDIVIIDSNYIDLNILEINSFLVITINVNHHENEFSDLNKPLAQLSKKYNAKHKIYLNDNSYSIKISIPIAKEE